MDQKWVERTAPDVKTSGALVAKILQFTGDKDRYQEADYGDFVLPFRSGRTEVIPGAKGVEIILSGAITTFVEWGKDVDSSGPVNRTHIRPSGLVRGSDWKWRRPNGNVVEETCEIYAHARVDGEFEAFCYPCKSSALPPAQKVVSEAFRIETNIGGVQARVIGGVYRLTSFLKKEGGKKWFIPIFTLTALVDQKNGPTPAELVKALDLRIAVQREEEAEKVEEAKLLAQERAALAIEHAPPAGRTRGEMHIESGAPPKGTRQKLETLAQRRPDLARDVKPTDPGKSDPDDDIPW